VQAGAAKIYSELVGPLELLVLHCPFKYMVSIYHAMGSNGALQTAFSIVQQSQYSTQVVTTAYTLPSYARITALTINPVDLLYFSTAPVQVYMRPL
jgi:hypothetical protein